MDFPDLNLLFCLDALLEEGSVAGAARKVGLSGPAMSRTLARIRLVVGDPIFVKVGRRMVPTPRAITLHEDVRNAVAMATRVLQTAEVFDPETAQRSFKICANDIFVGVYGGTLLSRIHVVAPRVTLIFSSETEFQDDTMVDQRIDLHITGMQQMAPDMHSQELFTTRLVGLVRTDHPILSDDVTPRRFASYEHISVSRRGRATGPIDTALKSLGLKRRVSLVVPNFHSAIFAACTSDLVMALPEHIATAVQAAGTRITTFDLPVPLETVVVRQGWHPRFQSDLAHQWLRRLIRKVCDS